MKRKLVIESSQKITLRLVLGGAEQNGNALSPFGPLRAGLITTHKAEHQALEELLNSLEKKATTLHSKSSEVLNIFLNDTTHLVEPTSFGKSNHLTTIKGGKE
jgi:hypothetical protein